MKKLIIPILFVFFLIIGVALIACGRQKQPEPLMEFGAAFNNLALEEQTDQILDAIAISQANYIKTHDRYWQGLKTHTRVPDQHATKAYCNNIDAKPSYQDEDWRDLMGLPDKMPFSVAVNQYRTPKDTIGYQVVFSQVRDGELWMKAAAYDKEDSRTAESMTYDWHLVVDQPYD